MADFKLTIADPKTGKCYQKEVKDAEASPFIGLNIGEPIKGDGFGLAGYEFKITGGSDYCGFPMRSGILGIRKRVVLYGGVGFCGKMRPLRKGKKRRGQFGLRKRRTVCGHKINENVTQINLSVLKEGSKKLADALGAKEGEKADAKPAEKPAEKPKAEAKPAETKEEQSSSKPQKPAVSEKPKEAPKEEKKEEAKKE
ncbi:30S ribosomal protein S6e [Candidatus Woesearchaeota archaeon]|nr:30S ribosomal protein S6e [Candidatus Woesearchaeota archaeon]